MGEPSTGQNTSPWINYLSPTLIIGELTSQEGKEAPREGNYWLYLQPREGRSGPRSISLKFLLIYLFPHGFVCRTGRNLCAALKSSSYSLYAGGRYKAKQWETLWKGANRNPTERGSASTAGNKALEEEGIEEEPAAVRNPNLTAINQGRGQGIKEKTDAAGEPSPEKSGQKAGRTILIRKKEGNNKPMILIQIRIRGGSLQMTQRWRIGRMKITHV